MSVNKFVAILIVSLGMMTNAFAASKSREFSMDANYINVQGQNTASLLNVSIGQFINPQIVIVTSLTSQQNFGYTGTAVGLGGKYYFFDGFRGDLVPFAGAGLALRQSATPTDSNHASTQYDLNVGLAFFMVDNTTLDAKVRLLNFNDSSPSITVFSVGFSQRF
jgi:hypothetical protein